MCDLFDDKNSSIKLSMDHDNGVAIISIVNPNKRNALNPMIMAKLSDAISILDKWDKVLMFNQFNSFNEFSRERQ